MDPQLCDEIYECAFFPEHWPHVLDQLAKLADGVGGYLISASSSELRWTASTNLSGGMERIAASGLLRTGQRPIRMSASQHAGFLTEHDLFTDDELATDPIYRDFLLPAGLGWAASTAIRLPTDITLFFTVERLHSRGPVERNVVRQLDGFRPDLARSALISARLHLERARMATDMLELIRLPALAFDQTGKVLSANGMMENLASHVTWRSQDRISLVDRAANHQFHDAVSKLDVENAAHVRSFAVRGTGQGASLVAHIIPIRRSARDIFIRCAGVLVLTPVAAPQAPPLELVQSLFDLTPAEARVARHLAAGDTLGEIAATGHVSRNTIRTQVRRVLEKTGCSRQAEVIALLGGISVSRC